MKKLLATASLGLAVFAFPQSVLAKCCCNHADAGKPVALSADGSQPAGVPAPYGYQQESPKPPEKTSWQDDVRRQQDSRN